MDMPMNKPMDDKDSDSYVKCPECGAKLCLESMAEDDKEDKSMSAPAPTASGDKPMGADKMPMDKLKSVLMSAKPKPEPQGI